MTEDRISELQDRAIEIFHLNIQRKQPDKKGTWRTITESWCLSHWSSQRRERKRAGLNKFSEKYGWKHPKFDDTNLQVQEAMRITHTINPKKFTSGCIKIKLLKTKDKEENLKATREEGHITSRETWI